MISATTCSPFCSYVTFHNYQEAVQNELGRDYPQPEADDTRTPLQIWYEDNPGDVVAFEKQMRLKVHHVIEPPFLWNHIAELARILFVVDRFVPPILRAQALDFGSR